MCAKPTVCTAWTPHNMQKLQRSCAASETLCRSTLLLHKVALGAPQLKRRASGVRCTTAPFHTFTSQHTECACAGGAVRSCVQPVRLRQGRPWYNLGMSADSEHVHLCALMDFVW